MPNSIWAKIGFVKGNGNSNSPKTYSFTDNNIPSSGTYCYRLKQIDTDGSFDYSEIINVKMKIALEFKLEQNFPNPFNPKTRINYSIPFDGNVEIDIYNIIGKKITTLLNEFKSAGKYNITFNGEDLSSGVYFYKLKAKSQSGEELSSFNKMILIK